MQRYVVSWRGAEAVSNEYVCGPTEALVYLKADVDALRTDLKAAFHELGGVGPESSKEFHRIGIDSAREILRRALDKS